MSLSIVVPDGVNGLDTLVKVPFSLHELIKANNVFYLHCQITVFTYLENIQKIQLHLWLEFITDCLICNSDISSNF